MTLLRLLAVAALAALLSNTAAAQTAKPYEPQVGQQGKDVIWVPTPDEIVERMLRMAQVTPNDYVIDLGAGDGKIAIMAAKKFGAKSLGIEYNPDFAKYAQENVVKAGVADKARVQQGDIFATDFKSATVLTMYLLPALNLKLRPTILTMKPGTRIVSHSFTMDDWQADEISSIDGRRCYFWVVPANVQGTWKLSYPNGEVHELTLEQRFQKIDGQVRLGTTHGGLRDAKLSGADITFAFVDGQSVRRTFTGRVNGSTMEGSLRADNGAEARWAATRQ